MSLEELKAGTGLPGGKVLSVAAFSDFQMDALSGQFCGEIRLAYLYETSGGRNVPRPFFHRRLDQRKHSGGAENAGFFQGAL